MDEWRIRWCPNPGEPIANNLLFYFYASKLFLNTFPLQTMLRVGDAVDDPECVSLTINSAKAMLELGHKYAELGVLRHCPDVNFLYILFSGVFLLKVKASNSRFSLLVDADDLHRLLVQAIADCQSAINSPKHAAGTASFMLRALLASWRMEFKGHTLSRRASTDFSRSLMDFTADNPGHNGSSREEHEASPRKSIDATAASSSGTVDAGSSVPSSSAMQGTLAPAVRPTALAERGGQHPATSSALGGSFDFRMPTSPPSNSANREGYLSGTQTPNYSHANISGMNPGDPLDAFLSDTQFFNSVLVSQGSDGFFAWGAGLETAGLESMDLDGVMEGHMRTNSQG